MNSNTKYLYLVGLSIYAEGTRAGDEDKLTICNSREECAKFVQEHVQQNLDAYKRENKNITHDDYKTTDIQSIVKWTDNSNDKKWIWWYSFYPIPIYENN